VQDATAAAPCPGAQTRGVAMIAITHPVGANVRSGPGRTFAQKSRFAPDCSVGFVGYCLGEVEPDLFYQSRVNQTIGDMRWFILPRGRGVVHAGVVASQGVDEKLPRKTCRGGVPMPDPPELSSVGNLDGTTTLEAVTDRAPNVGFAAYSTVDGDLFLYRIALDADTSDGFGRTWDPTVLAQEHGPGRGTVGVIAVVCLAAEAPTDLVDVVYGTLPADGQGPVGRATKLDQLSVEDQARLRRKACLLPPQAVGAPDGTATG